jgi:hypothetical protein
MYHLRSNSGSNGPIAKECHRFLVAGPFNFRDAHVGTAAPSSRLGPALGCSFERSSTGVFAPRDSRHSPDVYSHRVSAEPCFRQTLDRFSPTA